MANKGDPDVSVDEVGLVHEHGFLHGGHDAWVHAGQVLGSVEDHPVPSPLSLQGHSRRQEQIPVRVKYMCNLWHYGTLRSTLPKTDSDSESDSDPCL